MTTSTLTSNARTAATASQRHRVQIAFATAKADRANIEKARSLALQWEAESPIKPTLEQVSLVVSHLYRGTSLSDTAAALNLDESIDGEKFTLDIISTYGTWLAHSNGATGAVIDWAGSDTTGQACLFDTSGAPIVEGPKGYHPSEAHRRDVTKAMAAVVAAGQNPDVISRFVARTYATRQVRMSYPIIAGVWGFAVMNRLGTLARVSQDATFVTLAVEAYDLLDVARADGVSALQDLLTVDPADTDTVKRLATKADWIAERQMRAVYRAAERANDDAFAAARLARELGYLQAAFAAGSLPAPAGVRHLTLGQVQRITASHGIAIEAKNREEETVIRAELKKMGFATDTDMLLSQALTCAENGTIDRFWEILQARASGDPSWSDDLADLLS